MGRFVQYHPVTVTSTAEAVTDDEWKHKCMVTVILNIIMKLPLNFTWYTPILRPRVYGRGRNMLNANTAGADPGGRAV
jgi:hypothetical protein